MSKDTTNYTKRELAGIIATYTERAQELGDRINGYAKAEYDAQTAAETAEAGELRHRNEIERRAVVNALENAVSRYALMCMQEESKRYEGKKCHYKAVTKALEAACSGLGDVRVYGCTPEYGRQYVTVYLDGTARTVDGEEYPCTICRASVWSGAKTIKADELAVATDKPVPTLEEIAGAAEAYGSVYSELEDLRDEYRKRRNAITAALSALDYEDVSGMRGAWEVTC